MGIITDEARRWADEAAASYEFTVTERDIQRYASAIGATPSTVAPPLFPYAIRMQAFTLGTELEPDGSARGDVPPLPTKRAMAGETSITLGAPVVAGDVISVRKSVLDMYEKQGRSGPLVFVVFGFSFHNQRGEMVAEERFTRIFR